MLRRKTKMSKEIKKENKFVTLIIPNKDYKEFIKRSPEVEPLLNNIEDAYNKFRFWKGKKLNTYIICNQDEPYAEDVWQTILQGEKNKQSEKQ